MAILKRACRFCRLREVVRAYTMDEPNDVTWEVREDGFEHMIVHSTYRARYTHCTYCGANDA